MSPQNCDKRKSRIQNFHTIINLLAIRFSFQQTFFPAVTPLDSRLRTLSRPSQRHKLIISTQLISELSLSRLHVSINSTHNVRFISSGLLLKCAGFEKGNAATGQRRKVKLCSRNESNSLPQLERLPLCLLLNTGNLVNLRTLSHLLLGQTVLHLTVLHS